MSDTEKTKTDFPYSERRKCFRSSVHAGTQLKVRAWKIALGVPLSHQPMPSQEIKVVVNNISVGGLGVILAGKNGQPIELETSDRLRFEICHGEHELLIEARLRSALIASTESVPFPTGIQFQGSHGNIQFQKAQSALSAIVGCIQREELRLRQSTKNAAA